MTWNSVTSTLVRRALLRLPVSGRSAVATTEIGVRPSAVSVTGTRTAARLRGPTRAVFVPTTVPATDTETFATTLTSRVGCARVATTVNGFPGSRDFGAIAARNTRSGFSSVRAAAFSVTCEANVTVALTRWSRLTRPSRTMAVPPGAGTERYSTTREPIVVRTSSSVLGSWQVGVGVRTRTTS